MEAGSCPGAQLGIVGISLGFFFFFFFLALGLGSQSRAGGEEVSYQVPLSLRSLQASLESSGCELSVSTARHRKLGISSLRSDPSCLRRHISADWTNSGSMNVNGRDVRPWCLNPWQAWLVHLSHISPIPHQAGGQLPSQSQRFSKTQHPAKPSNSSSCSQFSAAVQAIFNFVKALILAGPHLDHR